jgi:hypothetical protein
MRRMYKYGLLNETQDKLDYVLALSPQDFLERRLQTLVFKQGLAKSIHHARVLIRQRHIRCGRVSCAVFMRLNAVEKGKAVVWQCAERGLCSSGSATSGAAARQQWNVSVQFSCSCCLAVCSCTRAHQAAPHQVRCKQVVNIPSFMVLVFTGIISHQSHALVHAAGWASRW